MHCKAYFKTNDLMYEKLQGHQNKDNRSLSASFTPNAKFVLGGFYNSILPNNLYFIASTDFLIYVWSVETGEIIAKLSGHQGVPTNIRFNPHYMMFASTENHNTVCISCPPFYQSSFLSQTQHRSP